MQSLKRKTLLWDDAARAAERDRQRAAAARTGQVVRSTVDVYGEPTQLDQMFEEASDTAALTSDQEDAIFVLDEDQASGLDRFLDGDGSDIEDVLDAGELGMENTEADADRWAEYDDSAVDAHEAHMDAIRTNELVTEAQTVADEALAEALKAVSTADGKNSIYAGMTEPVADPDSPFVQGDLWYVTDVSGRMVMVRIWNGSQWTGYQFVADSILVPGSVGATVIKDGSIVTQKLAATAVDGMTITGALIRTAPSGQRLQLDVNGLNAYDAAGKVTATIQSQGGYMTVNGGGLMVTQEATGPQQKYKTNVFGSAIVIQPTANDTGRYIGLSPDLGLQQTRPAIHDGGATWESATIRPGTLILGASYTRDTSDYFGQFSVVPGQGIMRLEYKGSPTAAFQKLSWYPHPDGGYGLSTNDIGVPVFIAKATHTEFRLPVRFEDDTDWGDCVLLNGTSMQGGMLPKARLRDKKIELQWGVSGSGIGANSARVACRLPFGIRPSANRYATAPGHSAASSCMIVVLSTGEIEVRTGATAPNYVMFDQVSVQS